MNFLHKYPIYMYACVNMTVFDLKHLTLDKNNAYVTRTRLLHDCKWKIYKGIQVLWKL